MRSMGPGATLVTLDKACDAGQAARADLSILSRADAQDRHHARADAVVILSPQFIFSKSAP